MPNSRDITYNRDWVAEQVDRLLGFEVLKKACTADPLPIPPALLADKIGLNKGFSYNLISKINNRQANAN